MKYPCLRRLRYWLVVALDLALRLQLVTLSVDVDNLTDRQASIAIRPGMQASVELHTGSKTILQYLLKPLYKSREAFHEP